MWSVIVFALAGPMPMLTIVMPVPSGAHEVVGRHLRQARRRAAERIARGRRQPVRRVTTLPGSTKALYSPRRVRHAFVPDAHELVDVELVVGEQHEILEVLGRRAAVVAQAVQRVVDPRRGEERQRVRLAGPRLVRAVGDAVVHRRQIGQVEAVAQQHATLGAHRAFDVIMLGEREVHRDRLRAGADLERDMVVAQQQPELLEVVVREQVGPGQRRLVAAGAGRRSRSSGASRRAPRCRCGPARTGSRRAPAASGRRRRRRPAAMRAGARCWCRRSRAPGPVRSADRHAARAR